MFAFGFGGIGPLELIIVLIFFVCPLAVGAGLVVFFLSKRPPTNLQPCPDCGRGLSPLAKMCPHCGRPLEN
jgi:hypothetical protein